MGDLQRYMTPGASNYFWFIFIFREVDMEYWRDLAKGTIGFLFYLEHL